MLSTVARQVNCRAPAALALLAAWAAAPPALAQTPVLGAGGFTGWSVTPSAQLQPWGTAAVGYDNEVVGGPVTARQGTAGHNLVAGFGLLPNLEISGRLASSTRNTNCYTDDCGLRDLSFNFKAGAPLDRDGLWLLAAGATDLGGQTENFRSLYGVLTYRPDPVSLSLGYARRQGTPRGTAGSPLDGVFASAAYRPLAWMQTHVEYADSQAWAGARVFAPAEWLPAGWSAHLGATVRVRGDNRTARNWWSVGLSVPLYKVPAARAAGELAFSGDGLPASTRVSSDTVAPASAPLPTDAPATAPPPPVPVTDVQLRELAELLRLKGFEDIAVGRGADGAVAVRVDNATYNVNTADGLGVALGVIARHLAEQRAGYRLVLTQRQLAIVGVTGQADCLAQWIAAGPALCTAGQLYTPGTTSLDALLNDTTWVVAHRAPSWATTRLLLEPILRSALATEYGMFDYSAGVRVTLQQPLWQGAYAEVSHVTALSESGDYRAGAVFGPNRLQSGTDRVLLHQLWRVPVERWLGSGDEDAAAGWGASAVTALAAVGRIDVNYRGAFAELRWEPGEGRHRWGLEGGGFERTTSSYDRLLPMHARTLLASYRYAYTPTRTSAELTAGQFLYNDRGVQLGIRQWFDDVSVSLYVRRTTFPSETGARTSAGIELSVPLTPRKDMSPGHGIQVLGQPHWNYAVATRIREPSNTLDTSQGIRTGGSVLDRTFNADRSGLAYFEDSMPRIRSAARR